MIDEQQTARALRITESLLSKLQTYVDKRWSEPLDQVRAMLIIMYEGPMGIWAIPSIEYLIDSLRDIKRVDYEEVGLLIPQVLKGVKENLKTKTV